MSHLERIIADLQSMEAHLGLTESYKEFDRVRHLMQPELPTGVADSVQKILEKTPPSTAQADAISLICDMAGPQK